MDTLFLATKLFISPRRPNIVLRPHLIKRLNEGLHRKLTLISASAGSGKTTLLSEWVTNCDRQTAWLSLDEEDKDPARFLAYLITALQTVAANFGEGVLRTLHFPQPPPIEAVLTALINEISALTDNVVLVLDDYHVINAKQIDTALAVLIEHLPSQLHLIIATREDPPLPLARLRARGQLTELRASDLRFTSAEAADFLNSVMGLSLSELDIAALETRTEGWIAGLQLAALSMQGRKDMAQFVRAFAGDNRYIVDYLVEEVLQHQPESVRSFLLQTSILDRLSGPLCDALTNQVDSTTLLNTLERGNLFVVPLDDTRYWFRYHHLFGDVIFARMLQEQSEQVPILHQRASAWYWDNGFPAEAIRHSLAAKDFARAADLVELAVPAMRRSRQEATLLNWLKALPDELVRHRPVLSVYYAGTLLQNGEIDGVETRLQDAERWLDMTADAGSVVVDLEELRRLPGWIAIYRAGQSLVRRNVPNTLHYAQQALDLICEDDYLGRGAAVSLLGLAYWTSGDLEAAHRIYTDGMAHLLRAGYLADVIGCTIALADIRIDQGRLHEAMRTYEHALQLAATQGEPVLRGTSDIYVCMSELHRERNDLHTATQHLLKSKALGEFTGLPQNRHRWCVAMARIREIQGDPEGALDLLNEAERLYMSDFFPNVRPIKVLKARVWVAQGRWGEALSWVREQGLSVEDDLSYLHEFAHITLVRMLLARYKNNQADRTILEAMRLLERLLKAAEDGGRTGHVIEILGLQALAQQTRGDSHAALVSIERALTLAESEGYIRMFVDEGPPMASLLAKAAKQGIASNYVRQLLAVFDQTEDNAPIIQKLTEPLSQRELEVLRLLKTDLNGPEIARELSVSLSTLRTHTQKIFSKLGAKDRRSAIRRAQEMGL